MQPCAILLRRARPGMQQVPQAAKERGVLDELSDDCRASSDNLVGDVCSAELLVRRNVLP